VKKNLKKYIIFGIAILSCMLMFRNSYAQESDLSKITQEFKKTFPKVQADSINKTEITDLYEVVAGTNIFYYSSKGFLIFGEILNTKGESLTAKRMEEVMAVRVNTLPLDKALKIGKGKNKVIEISDPDCPYCRTMSDFFQKRDDVTRYVFFYPLPFHPKAADKAKYILCSKDKIEAYKKVYSGEMDNKSAEVTDKACAEKAETALKTQMLLVANLGVKGTPVFWINNKFVPGADLKQIETLLNNGGK
jgi:thiol:disulfide interchange protein DsbC